MRISTKLLLLPLALLAMTGAAYAQAPSAENAAAGTAEYLAHNAREPGVKVLPSGLQYKVVHAGDPNTPTPHEGDAIKVNYEGALTSGQVFDSTFQRGKPMLMQLRNLVPAWMEALPLMHVGDEWTLYVPPELGYGEERAGPIPPNSVLVFRLQLLGMLSAN
jgi:FKBP-type peptidyl-prolyl cis-trans isomerase